MNSENKLKFFVDPGWRRDTMQHIPLLYPWWGAVMNKEKSPFGAAAFEQYPIDTTTYSIVEDISAADLILMPYKHTHILRDDPNLLDECIALSETTGKPLLVDGAADIDYPIRHDNVFVLRYGGYRFLRSPRDIIVPIYTEDLLARYGGGRLVLRKKEAMPTIGFTGWAEVPTKQYVRSVAKELPQRVRGIVDSRYRACKKGVFFRKEAVRILRASSLVKTDLIARPTFSGHRDTMSATPDQLRKEFVDNIVGNDYALDVRGDANASTRLFEILSLGRIPVIIDTERNLPWSDLVDYSAFSLIVDFRAMDTLPARIAEFHRSLTEERFQQMQKTARDAYVSHFRTDVIAQHIVREIRNRLC